MEKFLTKYFWIFNIAAVTAVAYLSATGVGEIAAGKIETLLPKAEAGKKTPAARPKKTRRANAPPPTGDAILSRNIFDSATGPISRHPKEETVDEKPPEQAVSIDNLPIVPCPMSNLKIISTVASKDDAYWSFAMVDSGGGNIKMYRMGDELNGRTVSGVTWKYLFLRGNTDECYMDMFPDPNAKAPAAPKKGPKPVPPPPPAKGADNRIQKLSDTEAVVERSLINELLANPTSFVKTVRVRPHREGGKVVGYKLRRFRANSPLAALGAQKGDIIRAVNGVDLTSMDKALGAYQSMRGANDLTFSITRNGKPMDLRVSIR
jgi:general secretion pathway protein C